MKHLRTHGYSLIELIAVIGVLLILVAIVLPKISREPTYIIVDDSVNKIKAVFLQAANLSLTQGVEVKVRVDTNNRTAVIEHEKKDKKSDQSDFSKSLTQCHISKSVTMKILKEEDKQLLEDEKYADVLEENKDEEKPLDKATNAIYMFYPDGSADGPPLQIDLEGETAILRISPLTGMLNVKKLIDGEEEKEGGDSDSY